MSETVGRATIPPPATAPATNFNSIAGRTSMTPSTTTPITSSSQNIITTLLGSSSKVLQNPITISDDENYGDKALKILNQGSRETSDDDVEDEDDLEYLYARNQSLPPAQVFHLTLNEDGAIVDEQQPANTQYRRVTNYKYSYSRSGKKNSRLIVPEANDKKLVRIYSNSFKGYFFCIGCQEIDRKRLKGRFNGSIFMAPTAHLCHPISRERAFAEGRKHKELAVKRNDTKIVSSGESEADNDDDDGDTCSEEMNVGNGGNANAAVLAANSLNHDQRHVNRGGGDDKRHVTPDNYEFHVGGLTQDAYGRIVVFEENDRSLIREYRKNSDKSYYCYDCKHVDKTTRIPGLLKGALFIVASNSQHLCQPKPYEAFLKEQKEYKDRHGEKRTRSRGRISTTVSPPKKITRIAEEETFRNEETPNDSVRDESEKVENSFVGRHFQRNTVTQLTTATAAVKNDSTNIKDDEKDEKPEYKPILKLHVPSTFVFYPPSKFYLTQACKKLNIKFNPEAYIFCNKMFIPKITSSSRPSKIHQTAEKEYHGFSCFSLYFTAAEAETSKIREKFNLYVYDHFATLGQCMGHDFTQFTHHTPLIRQTIWSNIMTEIHFELISRWFECRIGIHENGEWKHFGNWEEEDRDIPTFLLDYSYGKYNPILELED